MLREFRGAITALALVVCGVLLAASVEFGVPGQVLLQSLRFHIAAGLLGLVLLLFIGGAWRRALLFLLVFAVSAGQGLAIIYRQQEVRIEAQATGARPLFKLLSFNLLSGNEKNGGRIADFIIASGADLVMLMEASPLGPYRDKVMAAYPYHAGCDIGADCATVLLSRTPLENGTVGSLSTIWPDRLITAATTIGGQRINIVGAHLVKPYFDEFPYEEIDALISTINRLEGPLVLAGDFNSAAWTGNIDWLVRDARLAPGPSYPATWPVRAGPLGVPIDNVLTRPPLVVQHVEALDDAMGSNHRGLMAEIGLAPTP